MFNKKKLRELESKITEALSRLHHVEYEINLINDRCDTQELVLKRDVDFKRMINGNSEFLQSNIRDGYEIIGSTKEYTILVKDKPKKRS